MVDQFDELQDFAIGRDGNFYLTDGGSLAFKRPGTDFEFLPAGQPIGAKHLALGANGDLIFFDDFFHRIRKLTPWGELIDLVGNPMLAGGCSQEGALGTEIALCNVTDVAVTADGRVYYLENQKVWRLDSDGRLYLAAGLDAPEEPEESEEPRVNYPPLAFSFGGLSALTALPDGTFVVADAGGNALWQIGYDLPDYSDNEILIPQRVGQRDLRLRFKRPAPAHRPRSDRRHPAQLRL
ncbi:MAG: hypothetical protein HC937_01710 [Aquincola sp.]|nr:hypothetical protein [Aquincola sp.]